MKYHIYIVCEALQELKLSLCQPDIGHTDNDDPKIGAIKTFFIIYLKAFSFLIASYSVNGYS